jgi:hypothetical protein
MPKAKRGSTRSGRLRLPDNGRSKPIRNWKTLFGPPVDGAGAPDGQGPVAEGEANNPIARGVELGYRVMDEYVRQGQRAAGLRSGSVGPLETSGTELPQLTERMFQYASDFASVWMEAMGVMMRTRGTAGEGRAAEGSNGAGAPAAAEPPREQRPPPRAGTSSPAGGTPTANGTPHLGGATSVVVEVTSRRPVRAVVDLRPGPIDGPLVVSDLRARDPRRPRLKGVAIEATPDGKRLTIRVKVASDHPAGEYVGAVVDQLTAVTRGTLTVTVGGTTS